MLCSLKYVYIYHPHQSCFEPFAQRQSKTNFSFKHRCLNSSQITNNQLNNNNNNKIEGIMSRGVRNVQRN